MSFYHKESDSAHCLSMAFKSTFQWSGQPCMEQQRDYFRSKVRMVSGQTDVHCARLLLDCLHYQTQTRAHSTLK